MKLAPEGPWGDVPAGVRAIRMSAVALDAVTEVLPWNEKATAEFESAVGVAFPHPGRTSGDGELLALWSGRNAALVLGARVDIAGAVCVDQTDTWAALELSGPVRAVLSRLCPVDMRDAAFPAGATARTLLKHVAVSLTRVGEDRWLLLVPRSMAATVLEDVVAAAEMVEARAS